MQASAGASSSITSAISNTEKWMRELDDDHNILTEIRDRISDIGPDDDDKLRVLQTVP